MSANVGYYLILLSCFVLVLMIQLARVSANPTASPRLKQLGRLLFGDTGRAVFVFYTSEMGIQVGVMVLLLPRFFSTTILEVLTVSAMVAGVLSVTILLSILLASLFKHGAQDEEPFTDEDLT